MRRTIAEMTHGRPDPTVRALALLRVSAASMAPTMRAWASSIVSPPGGRLTARACRSRAQRGSVQSLEGPPRPVAEVDFVEPV